MERTIDNDLPDLQNNTIITCVRYKHQFHYFSNLCFPVRYNSHFHRPKITSQTCLNLKNIAIQDEDKKTSRVNWLFLPIFNRKY